MKSISVTAAVILVTALNLYNLERSAPSRDQPQELYDNYAYGYLMYIGISFFVLCLSYFSGYSNRIIKACLIVNVGQFIILAVKSYFHLSYKNNYYDHTFLGCIIIFAAYYLLSKHTRNIFISFKAILNQLYMRWPKKSQKKRKDYS